MSDRGARVARTTLAAALAVVLVYVLAMLIPPYLTNSRFQAYLEDAVARPAAPALLKTDIVNRAAQMGLPLQDGDVRVTPKPGNGMRVDVIYISRVDLSLYTVDLHFHPSAER